MGRGPAVAGENTEIVYGRRSLFGGSVRMGRRTAAHLDWTITELHKAHPNATLKILQGAFNKGVAASAHTHDYDAVLDVEIIDLSWEDSQHFLRAHGWYAWWRHTGAWAAQHSWHIHMISGGCTGKVGLYIDGGKSLEGRVVASSQIDDYRRHSFGLAGEHASGEDHSWFPPNIDATLFNYSAYLQQKEYAGMNNIQRIRHDVLETIRVNGPQVPAKRRVARLWVATGKRWASGGPDRTVKK